MSNLKKDSQLTALMQQIEKNTNFALVKYDKTSHITLEGLRRELKSNDANLKMVKNSLLEKAIQKLTQKNKGLNSVAKAAFPLKENTAILSLGEDWSKGLSAFHTFSEKEKTVGFKFGFLDNTAYPAVQLSQIAKLPGKDQLVAKLIGTMKAPMAHLTTSMKFNMQKFVYILNAKAKQS